MSPEALTPSLERSWREDGWCVVDGLFSDEEIARAQKALTHLFPTAEEMEAGESATYETGKFGTWDSQWPEFPFRSTSINHLILHDRVIDLAEQLLGTTDLRLYMGLMTAKYRGQSSGFNQLLHADYPNHSILVPREDTGYQELELFIYLSDVDEGNGATRLVSRSLTSAIAVERHTLSYSEYPEIYDAARPAHGRAGSIVCYRPDTYHCSIDHVDEGRSRFMLHVSFRPAAMDWGGYQAWPFKGFSPDWTRVVASSTPRQLALLGFPPPGHDYWTAATLDGVGARYPGLDMTPWRAAAVINA